MECYTAQWKDGIPFSPWCRGAVSTLAAAQFEKVISVTTAAEGLIRVLEEGRLEWIFSVPGVDNLPFFEALQRSALANVLVRSEATAGHAADAFMRVSGRSAVAFTTAGPGATNALTAVGEAWASGSAFLHITTTVPSRFGRASRSRGLPHYNPHQLEMFSLLAKVARHCGDVTSLLPTARECIRALAEPPFAPVHLEIPYDLLTAELPELDVVEADVDGDTQADLRRIEQAARLIEAAERPCIWAGSGSLRAAPAVLALAERLGAPVLITHSAKRRWPQPGHPLVVTYPPHEPAVQGLLEGSDVVLAIGSDLDAMMTKSFSIQLPTTLIRVDVSAERMEENYRAHLALVGRAEVIVPLLTDAVRTRGTHAAGTARAEETRRQVREHLADEGRGTLPIRFLDALDQALPGDSVVACDMAVAGYWAAGYLPLAPRRQLVYPIGWGTLGFGLPAAIGSAFAAYGRRVACVAGDAGLLYAVGELATVAEHRLPITVVVVDDQGYGMLRYAAVSRYGRSFAVDLESPDYAGIARAMGIPAWSAPLESPEMPSILREATSVEGPALVHLIGALVPPRMAILVPASAR